MVGLSNGNMSVHHAGHADLTESAGSSESYGDYHSTEKAHDHSSQSVRRIFLLLRVIASEGGSGLRLTEISNRAQLHLATTHRLLRALALERAVVYDPYSRLYHIGHDFLQQEEETLDQRVKNHFKVALQRIAEITHDTVFLLTRHGMDALYIHSVRGHFPAGTLPLDIGGRRPLGVGAGSLVLLASLPAKDLARTIDANEERYLRYGTTAQKVKAMLRAYRRDSYAFASDTVVRGLSAVGVPLHDEQGGIVGAISVLSASERLATEDCQHQTVRLIRSEIARAGEFVPVLQQSFQIG